VSLLDAVASARVDSGRLRGPNSRLGHGQRLLTRLLAVSVAAAMIVLLPAAALAAVGDWAQFRESQTHQANNTNEALISTVNVHALATAWTGLTGAAVDSAPAVANGVVYVGSSDGKLYAFAVGCATGGGACTPIWTATTGGAIDSSPAVVSNRVYVGSADGKLYVFSVGCATGDASCNPLWTATTGGAIHSSPAVDASVVYVGSSDGKLYAFDGTGVAGCSGTPKVCTPLWTATTGAAIESSPAVANGHVYVGSDDTKLYAFAVGCASGGAACTPQWTATTGGAVHSSPSVLTGVVYVGSLDGKVYAFDGAGVTGCVAGSPTTCTPLWTGTTGGPIYSSPSVGDGSVKVGSDDGNVYAFHIGCSAGGGSCTPLWTGHTGGTVRSSPATANGVLYVGSSDGKIYAFNAVCGTGGVVCPSSWTSTIGTAILSSPAVSGGVVYVGSSDHKLYAFHLVVDHLVLSPANASIAQGATQAYTAEGFDSSNVDLGNLTAFTNFTITGSGTCTANACGSINHGSYTVTGTFGSTIGTTGLTVLRSGSTFFPITPVRLLDTRVGNGLPGKLAANGPQTFQVTGRGGVPSNATAVTGNVTVVNSTFSWAVFLGPNPIANPSSSTINFLAGETTSNGLTVALSSSGTLSATYMSTAGNTTDLVFDVTGYFVPDLTGGTYHPMTPSRLLDTRSGNGLSGKLVANTPRTFQVTGRGGVPANATAVTGNVTVVNSSFSWAVFVGPNPTASPTTSTINFTAGQIKANSLTVELGAGGGLSATYISSAGNTTDLVFDVTGYYTADGTGSTFVPIAPARLLDTRFGNGLAGKFAANTPRSFQVSGRGGVPTDATGVTGNVTVVDETNAWAVFVGPDPLVSPTTSTLNFNTGDIKANGLTVALGSGGMLSATYISTAGNTTDLVFDVTGYYLP
jgi:outer membrane protein assembly factor BamB